MSDLEELKGMKFYHPISLILQSNCTWLSVMMMQFMVFFCNIVVEFLQYAAQPFKDEICSKVTEL